MAKREPKLGDVRYRKHLVLDAYEIKYFCNGRWHLSSTVTSPAAAKRYRKRLTSALADIIRKARETKNGK